jgi:hypothetical protein
VIELFLERTKTMKQAASIPINYFSDSGKLGELIEEKEIFPEFVKDRMWNAVIGQRDFCAVPTTIAFNEGLGRNLCGSTISEVDEVQDPLQSQMDSHGTGIEKPIFYHETKTGRRSQFTCMQKWRGVVLQVREDCFLARLEDIKSTEDDEEAEILLQEISEEDFPLLKPGSVFYWNIGYHTDPAGQRKRSSLIRFRRIPVWTIKEIEEAKNKAGQYKNVFGLKSAD